MASTRSEADGASARRLRIALVYDCLYPQTIGGIEHRSAQLAAALAERGHQVTVVGMGEPAPPRDGVEILTLGPRPSDGASRGARHTARFALAMARLPLDRFDAVEAANIPFAHLLPLALRCRIARVPLIVTWHEVWGDNWARFTGPLWPLFAALEFVCAQLGERVSAVSRLTAGRLSALRGGDRIPVLPNGIPLARVAEAAAEAQPGPPLISAGRLLPHKRLDLLIDAVALLPRTLPTPLLTLIGVGPDRERLQERAHALGIEDRVVFTGRLATETDVWRTLGGARIAIQPSAREGFGIFPLEAMAAGLPVVYCEAADSAVGELVRPDVEGVAVAPNAASLASTVAALLADPVRLRALATAAERRAKEFDWHAVAERFEALLIHEPREGPPAEGANG